MLKRYLKFAKSIGLEKWYTALSPKGLLSRIQFVLHFSKHQDAYLKQDDHAIHWLPLWLFSKWGLAFVWVMSLVWIGVMDSTIQDYANAFDIDTRATIIKWYNYSPWFNWITFTPTVITTIFMLTIWFWQPQLSNEKIEEFELQDITEKLKAENKKLTWKNILN